jgi:hypothetical protein
LAQHGITSNYSAIADFHNSQFTTAPAKPSPACCVFTNRSLATVSNSGDSSTSRSQVLISPTFVQNCLSAILSATLNRCLFSDFLQELNCIEHYKTVRIKVTLRFAVYRQSVRLGAEPLETHGQNFFQFNTCGHNPYITSSLKRGWVCHLQLLLALASAFILGSESRGTRDHILRSQIRDFPFCRLLRRAGLRWRYSTPPPHRNLALPNRSNSSQRQSYFATDGQSISKSWCRAPFGAHDQIFITL